MSETGESGVGPEFRQRLADEVCALMGRRRVSGAKLARAIKIPQATLQRRLSGHAPFDVETLAQIAEYLDAPLGDLLHAAVYLGGGAATAVEATRKLTPAPTPGLPDQLRGVPRSAGRGGTTHRYWSPLAGYGSGQMGLAA